MKWLFYHRLKLKMIVRKLQVLHGQLMRNEITKKHNRFTTENGRRQGPQAYRKFIILEHSQVISSECLPYPNVGCAPAPSLRAHIGSSHHLRLRVLCPWCFDGEKTSNRVRDLKKHVATKHAFDKLFGDKFFSDGNGFYLAMFPKDYARIITPTPPS